jgi:hypothetical protein
VETGTEIDLHGQLLNRLESVVALLHPEEMTPTARRLIESVIDDERTRSKAVSSPVDSALQEWSVRLVDMWRNSPETRKAVAARWGPLAWAIDHLAEEVEN